MIGRSLAPGVTVGLCLVLGALAWVFTRLAVIQLEDRHTWTAEAHALHQTRARDLVPERGALLDRRGRLLAHTESLPSVAIDPTVVKDKLSEALELVRQELGVEPAAARKAIENGSPQFAYLKRHVHDRAAVDRLQTRARAAGIQGIIVLPEPRRVYPCGSVAAHVLGFTRWDGRGVEGMEHLANTRLAGTPGVRRSRVDGLGRRIAVPAAEGQPARPGEDVHLTLDLAIQTFVEQAVDEAFAAHAPKAVVAAVVEVGSGDLLALACRPNFDPNRLVDSVQEHRRNRFFTDSFEPGSTFKPLVMGLALDRGVVHPGDVFDCSGGVLMVNGRRIREDEHHDYGLLSASDVIARSSNVGMVQVGQRLGIDALYRGVRRLGFGTRTAVRWPGETAGRMTSRTRWTDTWTLPSVSFGHEIAVSPAQLLTAYAAIADGGLMRPLRLVQGQPVGPPVRVLEPAAAAELTAMLERVMETGTGRRAALHDYRVAGKTGTAQKFAGREIVGHVGTFVCFAPVRQPRLAVIVMCDEPQGKGYGSVVAAPYATRILHRSLRYLGVAPDRERTTLAAVGRAGEGWTR